MIIRYLSGFPDHNVVVVTISDAQDVSSYTVASTGQREFLYCFFEFAPGDNENRQKKVRQEWFFFFKNPFTHPSRTLSRLLCCPGTFSRSHKSLQRLMSGLLQHQPLLFFKPLCLIWKSTCHCLLGRPHLFWVHHTGLAATGLAFSPNTTTVTCIAAWLYTVCSVRGPKISFLSLMTPHVFYVSLTSSFANVSVRWLHPPRWK